jgi:5-methylthioadenosine/S-adenosylhomocysteine deaminase
MTETIVSGAVLVEGFDAQGDVIVHRDAALLVRDGRVATIGTARDLMDRHPAARIIGGRDSVIVPGFVNAHHHVGLTPFQLGSPDHPLELWFASRLALRDVDLRLDTLYSACEMLASGVTTVQHLHSRAPGDADAVLAAGCTVMDAYREIGLRASYSMALRDQNRLVYEDDRLFTERLPAALRPAMAAYFSRFTLPLATQLEIFEALRATIRAEDRIAIQIAPANLHWLSDDALTAAADLHARHGLPLHMHVLETPYQKEYAHRRTGGSAIAYLARFGLLGPQLTIGHGVWLSEAEIEQCAHSGARICHNCSSNLRLKSGVAPVNRFLARGIPVALGIDEAGINDDRDMLQEMRLALRMHREPGIDAPFPTCAEIFRMATENGAATTPFGDRIGRLSPGSAADLVLFDWKAVTWPYQDIATPIIDVLLHRARTTSVKTVMIAGDVVWQDGRPTKLDRDALHEEIAQSLARPLTSAEKERVGLARDVFPHVREFYTGWLDALDAEPHYKPSSRR